MLPHIKKRVLKHSDLWASSGKVLIRIRKSIPLVFVSFSPLSSFKQWPACFSLREKRRRRQEWGVLLRKGQLEVCVKKVVHWSRSRVQNLRTKVMVVVRGSTWTLQKHVFYQLFCVCRGSSTDFMFAKQEFGSFNIPKMSLHYMVTATVQTEKQK